MKTLVITIVEVSDEAPAQEHYMRRVDVASIDTVIEALDGSLKALPKQRKQRSDTGSKKRAQ